MEYKVIGTTVPAVEVSLNPGESLFTQTGGMAWQTEGIEMSTNAKGGVLKGLGRMFSGESFFMVTYTAKKAGKIAFAATVPGAIAPINLAEVGEFIVQKGAFLCAEDGVELKTELTKKLGSGFLGGEGFVLQKISGRGTAFLEVEGDMVEYDLAPGEVLKVDTGNVVGFQPSVSYEIEMVKGFGNVLFGGEGLFLTKLTGPGRVMVQTLSFNNLAQKVISLIPSDK